MAFSTQIKSYLNRFLSPLNARIDTLTADRAETRRLDWLDKGGHFERPVFPTPPGFETASFPSLLAALSLYESRFRDFTEPEKNGVGFTFANHFYTSPDAEILYALVREVKPRTIIEVGCGNSTKIMRLAIMDASLATRIISIDPHPRTDIKDFADEIYSMPVEAVEDSDLFASLGEGDILFIDSSHEIKTGNDNPFLYLNVLPMLRPGVLVQIHDIFLPYDYPREWVIEKRWGFNEQYIVQSLLMSGRMFEVLWAGYYLQRTLPDFARHFPNMGKRVAKSLWLKRATDMRPQ